MPPAPARPLLALTLAIAAHAAACGGSPTPYVEQREPCAEHNDERNLYFGDLHVHTGFSFDAFGYEVRVTPEDAYAFAQGAPVLLPPVDGNGQPTREVRLERPLDFVMVSDHGEFLGEVSVCTTPGAVGYDSDVCRDYQAGGENAVFLFGFQTSLGNPTRMEVCGPGATDCIPPAARQRWEELQRAAESHYDRTAACSFVTFVGYEYTNTLDVANNHRHVMFRNDRVPELPISYYEAPTPPDLWRKLARECLDAGDGCDALTIAHNSNLSNGNEYASFARTLDEEQEVAALRARVELVGEIFQHKGQSECRNGFASVNGAADPACDFEQIWPADAPDCGDGLGTGGMRLWGCVSRHDFLRNVLKDGLADEVRLGVNPLKLGLVGSTDTHNGTPGRVEEYDFPGHVGDVDDTPDKRLGAGNVTHDGVINNPGGLAAVWAEERSRDAIFAAVRRHEVYATSGPRIAVRFFGGWGYDAGLCDDPGLVGAGYAGGVPMGGDLPAAPGAAAGPTFVVDARRDPGTAAHPGTALDRIQIVKGWLDANGAEWEEVTDVAVGSDGTAGVDPTTCEPTGPGADRLCAVWTDPGFDPAEHAFYYVRVLENPTCRWSAWECLRLDPADRPAVCDDGSVPATVQERAWTSPIWYTPGG